MIDSVLLAILTHVLAFYAGCLLCRWIDAGLINAAKDLLAEYRRELGYKPERFWEEDFNE